MHKQKQNVPKSLHRKLGSGLQTHSISIIFFLPFFENHRGWSPSLASSPEPPHTLHSPNTRHTRPVPP